MPKPERIQIGQRQIWTVDKSMPERADHSLTRTGCIGKRTEAETVEHEQNEPTDHSRTIAEYLHDAKQRTPPDSSSGQKPFQSCPLGT